MEADRQIRAAKLKAQRAERAGDEPGRQAALRELFALRVARGRVVGRKCG